MTLKGLGEPTPTFEVEWRPAVHEADDLHPASRDPRSVQFVGRAAQMLPLESELEAVMTSGLRVVLVAGDPGVGKTRLTTELLARARPDVVALTARAYPLGATASLGLWVEALYGYLRSLDPEDVRT